MSDQWPDETTGSKAARENRVQMQKQRKPAIKNQGDPAVAVQRMVRNGYRMSMYDGRKLRNVMRLGGNPADIAAAVQSELDRNPNQSIRIAPNATS